MRTINIKGHRIEIFDSIEELPIKRFHKYNKMLLIDAGIGSDLTDFDAHLQKVLVYLKNKDNENAITELDNMRQNVYMVQTEMSPRHLAFATLVYTLDGEFCEELTDGALQRICEKLSDLTEKEITTSLEAVKKKIDEELQIYFPTLFDDVRVKEYYNIIRKRTLLMLDNIINDDNSKNQEQIAEINDKLLMFNKPKKFNGKDNAEIAHDKSFERICVVISQVLHVDPKKYSVLEFYNAYEYIQEMQKEQKKAKTRQI